MVRTSVWAGRAILAFRDTTGAEEQDVLSDLLADLMHWAGRNSLDFDRELLRARDHYHAETAGDGS